MNTPKPLLPCGNRPFIAWLLREFVRFGVEEFLLLAGHLADAVDARVHDLSALLPRAARIVVCREPLRAGTGGAVFHAREHLDQRFLLCNGDSLFDCNLATLLAAASADEQAVTGRILLREFDNHHATVPWCWQATGSANSANTPFPALPVSSTRGCTCSIAA